jgi:hypothetical protein
LVPGLDELQVFREVDRLQLVVDELPDVPGKVVVPETTNKSKVVSVVL